MGEFSLDVGNSVYLDFEFNRVTQPKVNLVSCCTFDKVRNQSSKFWLHNSPREQRNLSKYLKQFKTIIGYACVAEARSFLSLDLNPLDFGWIDEFLEYRLITNHNDRLNWGKQLVDGKVRFFKKPKPKWERTEEDSEAGFKPTHSLAEATYKLTGEIRDTVEKDEARTLIISNPSEFTKSERERILAYNMEDVTFLPKILNAIKNEFRELDDTTTGKQYISEALTRGRYSAHTAIMESTGYPINVDATRNFSKQIPAILSQCQRDINAQFPEGRPFKWNKKGRFSWNQKLTRAWLEENVDVSRWMKTEKGALSLSLEAFEKHFAFKHSYPRGNFGGQVVRFLKLRQSLYGFSETGGKRKNFWDSVGSDGRVRPYMNIFGAQSGRSQPAASGFMFLKPAWMRSLVETTEGKFLGSIDYGQQEFFLSAMESNDQTMIDAYLSGDPYLFGAKLAGAIPENGTKASHPIERDLFKNTYLGILYGMSKYGLAIKLTNDMGVPVSEEHAQAQIDIFEESFPDYMEWKKDLIHDYEQGAHIRLPCGWRMWNDNPNIRSVCNVPIQGFGASIMRKAVDIAVSKYNLKVIFTLHDALYIEGESKRCASEMSKLYLAMLEAFQFFFLDSEHYDTSGNIKLDPFVWSPDFKADSEKPFAVPGKSIDCPASNLYIDERAGDEYGKFKIYFNPPDTELL